MLRNPRRIAPFLFASLIGSIVAGAAARAEPAAAAASSATADCLAKPNAPSASGHHWYYHIDRASGRHCWYQRAVTNASGEANQSRTRSRATVSAPIDKPIPEPSEDMRSEAGDQDTATPATTAAPATTATIAPPAQPYSWSTAASQQIVAPTSDSATPSPVATPQPEAVTEPPQAEPVQPTPMDTPTAPMQAQSPTQPAAVVEDGAHMPAILGAGFALLIIVLGSTVARLGASFIRTRRRSGPLRAPASIAPVAPPPPMLHAQEAPALVPPMPHEGDLTRAPRPPRPRRARAPRQDRVNAGDATAAPDHDSTRELEANVRDLLRRMRSDLPAGPRAPLATERPREPSAQELDQVLAMWREGRRRAR